MTTAPASTIHTVQHTDQEQQQTENDAVEAWRLQQLLDHGLDQHRADQLAHRTDIDLHHTLQLLDQGCDPKTLLRILL